ncbi:4-hydroxy-tetrahydrodipicolinate synthase, partial [Rhizobium sp. BK609]|nr:4-hydroxy-tetrahydrodipicolinate synthase [Rhizobium sp. BK098]MBB3618876.1 4-hydroxy-tetrahydrodipicolinate synthase [Rhizobium sp. BK609]MBB3684532.1 4-hydroxy-tetrahydrodipicolinate synthase [Rhizobium sp. BK612]MDR6903620.1 4-hydroxy-tetrahydrodipicolinate synthase [Rhizobium miluonense]
GLDVGPVRVPGVPRLDEKDREELFALLRRWREAGELATA